MANHRSSIVEIVTIPGPDTSGIKFSTLLSTQNLTNQLETFEYPSRFPRFLQELFPPPTEAQPPWEDEIVSLSFISN
jgi:hypothetical protein